MIFNREIEALNPKAFAVDVDGTITEDGGVVNLEAVFALRWMEKFGLRVILTSGRTPLELFALAIYLGTTRVIVGENGGVVAISPTTMALLADRSVCLEAYEILSRSIEGVKIKPVFPRFTDVVLERSFDIEAGRRVIEQHNLPVQLNDSKYAYHINQREVSKATGLMVALKHLTIDPEDTIAIGDSETDIPMFKLCGYSIALANAPTEAKLAAKHVTKSENGEGLVEALNHVAEGFFKVKIDRFNQD
jgi:phosphoglycolate phosphatase (TIGR01487 family)